ncbi:hypothetical protein GN278_11010 [Rhodobacteraceae bacterium Araon29]
MDGNDFINSLINGSYAVLFFYAGRFIWWPEGSISEALRSFGKNIYWNLYGLALSIGPAIESLSNVNLDSNSNFFVYCLGAYWAYYCLNGTGLEKLKGGNAINSIVGALFLLFIPPQLLFASIGFLEVFDLVPPLRADDVTWALAGLTPIIFVVSSLVIYSNTIGPSK